MEKQIIPELENLERSKNIFELQDSIINFLNFYIRIKMNREIAEEDLMPKSVEQLKNSIQSFVSKKLGGVFINPNYSEPEVLSYLKQQSLTYLNATFRHIIALDKGLVKRGEVKNNDIDKNDNAEINRHLLGFFKNSEDDKKEEFKNVVLKMAHKTVDVINKIKN